METQTKKSVSEHRSYHCPGCGSDKIWRIQRSVPEKIIYSLSGKKFAAKKYQCSACSSTFLIHGDGKQPQDGAVLLETGMEHLITCPKCGKATITIAKISDDEMHRLSDGSEKVPFRKLICFHCRHEEIIFKEDYDQANNDGI